jgi:hypothetical protein
MFDRSLASTAARVDLGALTMTVQALPAAPPNWIWPSGSLASTRLELRPGQRELAGKEQRAKTVGEIGGDLVDRLLAQRGRGPRRLRRRGRGNRRRDQESKAAHPRHSPFVSIMTAVVVG